MPRTEGKPLKMYGRNISNEKSSVSGGVTEVVEFNHAPNPKRDLHLFRASRKLFVNSKKFGFKTMDILHCVKCQI